MQSKVAIIIGAGPAGLTAGYELLARSGVRPVILEMSTDIGGISKTIEYKGNRLDMGGHRFFSKSSRVMDWWRGIMPLQGAPALDELLLDPAARQAPKKHPDPEQVDLVLLLRRRISRIFYLRKFFDYPISLNLSTVANLGPLRLVRIGCSYLWRALFPVRPEKSLEDFLKNRFGDELYRLFFEDYTEKVWGVKASAIRPDWGAQRIKGLSVTKVLAHAAAGLFRKRGGLDQKDVETSLIEQFLYPKLGPGQLWEEVARRITELGGEIRMRCRVVGLRVEGGRVVSARVRHLDSGEESDLAGDWFFSSMPVRELVEALGEAAPPAVREVARGLVYRDFLTVGLLLRRLKVANTTRIKTPGNRIPDLWIYIQERDVKMGRLQVFNNWSPYLVRDQEHLWVGLEYFCTEGDELYSLSEAEMKAFAIAELVKLEMIDAADVLDATVVKVPKAYPAYFGSYDSFDVVRGYTDSLANLFLVGRNGQHRYNNMDHSMLTAMAAVENILAGETSKANIWTVNAEQEYHEQK